jgi:hypothetical protein
MAASMPSSAWPMAARRPPAVAELRQRTERLQTFPDLESVETELLKLITYSEGPIIACLPACWPRTPGRPIRPTSDRRAEWSRPAGGNRHPQPSHKRAVHRRPQPGRLGLERAHGNGDRSPQSPADPTESPPRGGGLIPTPPHADSG